MNLSRRHLIKISALGSGGLLVALMDFDIWGQEGIKPTDRAKDALFAPNIWIEIHSSGEMVFILDKVEMGQSIYTGMAMVLCEELDIEPHQLRVKFAEADRKYGNPSLMGLQMTGGSTSMPSSYEPLRRAGATAREILIQSAAAKWGVSASSCNTNQGFVIHESSTRKFSYGELAQDAAKMSLQKDSVDAKNIKLKDPKTFKLIGKPHKRLDGEAKVQGKATFGIDVDVPNALVAVLVRPPEFQGQIESFDKSEAEKVPGVQKIFATDGGIAIVANKYHQVIKARELLKCQWKKGPLNQFHSSTYMADLAVKAKEMLAKAEKDLDLKTSGKILESTYEMPFLAHQTLEPQNCTAHVTKDQVILWAPTQAPGLLQQLAAKVAGVPTEKVVVHQTFLGGGFGRRLSQDYGIEAVTIAKHFEVPIKLMWSREDDTRHDFYRPAMVHILKASLTRGQDPQIETWAHGSSGASILGHSLPSWMSLILPSWVPDFASDLFAGFAEKAFNEWNLIPDATSMEGAAQLPYQVKAHSHKYLAYNPGVPVGFWRSVGHSHTAFAVESFVDELAFEADINPMDFRQKLLQNAPRNLRVLRALREFSRWDSPKEGFQGVAVHESFGSVVGQVVELRIIEGKIKVDRVYVVIDCGLAVNPLHVHAQMTGSVVFGLTAALYSEITIKNGAVQEGSFDDYPLLRYGETPEIEVQILPSSDPPTGVGEPGVPPVAPALANALFKATGKRLRKMPLRLS